MEYEYQDYYFYSNSDAFREPIGTCTAGTLGIAVIHFAAMKAMSTEDFLSIYSVGLKK
jgi:NO-binding membrane sensor protein with MHYT domain